MCPFQVAPRGGGISAAISRRLPVVAGPGPGFEPESPGKGECGGGHGKGAPRPAEVTWKDAAGGRRGTGRALQEVDGSTRCLRTGRCPVGAQHISCPAAFGGLDVWCAGFPSADPIPTPSSKLGLGSVGTKKDGHPQSPIPTILF